MAVRHLSARRRVRRLPLAIGIAVFLVLVGTSGAAAQWVATSSPVAGTVSAGSLAFAQSGASALAKSYSPSSLVAVAPITVANIGTVPSAFSLQVVGSGGSTLTGAITVWGWPVVSAAACTVTPPAGVAVLTGPSLSAGFRYSGPSLAPGSSAFYCVKTSITSAQAAQVGQSATLNVFLTASIGAWSSSSTANAVQKVVDSTPPSVPTSLVATAVSASQISLTWAASTDNVAVSYYSVYRKGVVIATVIGTTFADTGLTANTAYSYTVKSVDAAGNVSGVSAAASATTWWINPSSWYTVVSANSGGLCVDGDVNNTKNGAVLAMWGCNATDYQKQWQFVPVGGGYAWVKARYAPALGWKVDGGSGTAGAKVQLWSYGGGTYQEWLPQLQSNGYYHFVNRNSALCLDVIDGATVGGTRLQQWPCGYPNVNQDFSLKAVG